MIPPILDNRFDGEFAESTNASESRIGPLGPAGS